MPTRGGRSTPHVPNVTVGLAPATVPTVSRQPAPPETTAGAITRGSWTRYDRNAGWQTPLIGVARPGGAANGQSTTSGGIAINPGPGIQTNGGNGSARQTGAKANSSRAIRPVVPGPSGAWLSPGMNGDWHRRHQRSIEHPYGEYNIYPQADYNYGGYGPVFVFPTNYYYAGNADMAAPVDFSNVAPSPGDADYRGEHQPAEAQPAAQSSGLEQTAENRYLDRREQKRFANTLSQEKLHDWMLTGTNQFHQGKYDQAAATFLRVTLADRTNVDATLAYAAARFATGDYQISSLAVQRGVRRLPEIVDSDFDVRDRYGDQRHFTAHLDRLERFVRDNGDNHDGWMVLGFIRHFSGQRELARETFERLLGFSRSDAIVAEIFLNAAAASPPKAVSFASSRFPLPRRSANTHPQALITVDE